MNPALWMLLGGVLAYAVSFGLFALVVLASRASERRAARRRAVR